MTDLDLFVDVMCVHSHLAYPQLRAALDDVRLQGNTVGVRIHPLLIVPGAPVDHVEPLQKVHQRQFGPDWASMEQAMTRRAAAAGVLIRFETVQFTSTAPALSAVLQAQERDARLGEELLADLFDAYFAQGALISDLDWLASFCSQRGLRGLDLSEEQFDVVREASERARREGIAGAPTLRLPNGRLITGARSRQEYLALLQSVVAGGSGPQVSS
ncbi:DsbA family oxidoreductase [Dermacoccaceae bacterium W4C1]